MVAWGWLYNWAVSEALSDPPNYPFQPILTHDSTCLMELKVKIGSKLSRSKICFNQESMKVWPDQIEMLYSARSEINFPAKWTFRVLICMQTGWKAFLREIVRRKKSWFDWHHSAPKLVLYAPLWKGEIPSKIVSRSMHIPKWEKKYRRKSKCGELGNNHEKFFV